MGYYRLVPTTGGSVLLGEVSTCNDDENDNRFADAAVGSFLEIEEDELPYRLLCKEYPI
ncbi:MAG: D-lyxose/D-mannose family sugar isomerase [Lacrimispora sphenoides]